MRRWILLAIATAAALTAVPVSAQPNCGGGTVYDDGTFEAGYRFLLGRADLAMLFDPGAYPATLERACLCWFRTSTDTRVAFDLRVWAADGESGGPGTLLAEVPTLLSPVLPQSGFAWGSHSLGSEGIVINGPVYIGPSWFPNDDFQIFLCADQSFGTPRQRAFGGVEDIFEPGAPPDQELGSTGFFPEYRALGVRAEFGTPTFDCVQNDHTLCLLGGRFRVEVDFTPPNGSSQPANAIPFTDRAGMFWFFNENNIEMLVKMQNACVAPFNRFWFFFAATTNVQFQVRVTDTDAGLTKSYDNPQGMVALPVADTQAFATCP